MSNGTDFHIVLSGDVADKTVGRGFNILPTNDATIDGQRVLPMQAQLFGQTWYWMYAGECKRIEQYETIGDRNAIDHQSTISLSGSVLQSINTFLFLRDRAEEFFEREPDQALYRCLEEGVLSLFEVFDDGAFDFILVRHGLAIAFSHFKPIYVAFGNGYNATHPGTTHIASSVAPPSLNFMQLQQTKSSDGLDKEAGNLSWQSYQPAGRARGKLLAAVAGVLILEEPVW